MGNLVSASVVTLVILLITPDVDDIHSLVRQ
jgi:hypothetical protein